MRSLGGGDEVDRSGAQRRLLGRPGNGHKAPIGFELMHAHLTHFRVRFDSKNGIPVFQEKPGKHALAESDVSDDVTRLQSAFGTKQVEDSGRKSGACADVVLHPIPKTSRVSLIDSPRL